MRLHLEVITPAGVVLAVETPEVTLPGSAGELGVLPGHTPLLAALRPGVLSYRGASGRECLAVADGCARVDASDRVLVITKAAAAATSIDLASVRDEVSALRQRLRGWHEAITTPDGAPSPEHAQLEQDLLWAEARLAVATTAS